MNDVPSKGNGAALFVFTTQRSNRLRKPTRRRPTRTLTEASSLSALNAHVTRMYCPRQVSMVKRPAESTTLLSRRNVTLISPRIRTPMSHCLVASMFRGISERKFKESTAWPRSRRILCGHSTRVKALSMDRRMFFCTPFTPGPCPVSSDTAHAEQSGTSH